MILAVGATLIDTSVLLDVLTDDPVWGDASSAALASALDAGRVIVDPVVYAEAGVRYDRIESLVEDLDDLGITREPLPWDAAFLAGKAFVAYRRAGGSKERPLPDFFIGAHAAVGGHALLTRDPARVRTYFPTVQLIVPERRPR